MNKRNGSKEHGARGRAALPVLLSGSLLVLLSGSLLFGQQRYAIIDENGVLKEHGFVDYPSLANRVPVPEDFKGEPGKARWDPAGQQWMPHTPAPAPPPPDPDVDLKTALDKALADPLLTPALKDLFTAWKARLEGRAGVVREGR